MAKDSTQRFTDRVSNYVKYRPDYPVQVINYLHKKANLSGSSILADIGSGTGIFTKRLLDTGCKIFAVEPNEKMRAAADHALAVYPNYISVNGTASITTLNDHSIDLIVSAQAFHWFNTAETKSEFQRILTATGKAALIWNKRDLDADGFSKAYDQLLRQNSTDYKKVHHHHLTTEDFAAFFRNGKYDKVSFPNFQILDEEGLIGRAYSSSYVPTMDTEEGKDFLVDLKEIFRQYQDNGKVKFQYHTDNYLGQV